MSTGKKPDSKPVPQRVPKHGNGKLNVGGYHNGGRPKDEWKAKLRELASSDTVLEGLQSILSDKTHPQYLKALEFAAERGYGKEVTPVEQSGSMALNVVIRSE